MESCVGAKNKLALSRWCFACFGNGVFLCWKPKAVWVLFVASKGTTPRETNHQHLTMTPSSIQSANSAKFRSGTHRRTKIETLSLHRNASMDEALNTGLGNKVSRQDCMITGGALNIIGCRQFTVWCVISK